MKDPAKELEDLQKAAWYLNREIENRKAVVVALQSQAEQAQKDQITAQPMFHGSIVKVDETPTSMGHLSTD